MNETTASIKYVFLYILPFHREIEMGAKLIIQMDGKKTRIMKPYQTTIDNNNISSSVRRENYNDFTFDYSYWSFERAKDGQHVVTQEEVYRDLGIDVINCAFEGMKGNTILEDLHIHESHAISYINNVIPYNSIVAFVTLWLSINFE